MENRSHTISGAGWTCCQNKTGDACSLEQLFRALMQLESINLWHIMLDRHCRFSWRICHQIKVRKCCANVSTIHIWTKWRYQHPTIQWAFNLHTIFHGVSLMHQRENLSMQAYVFDKSSQPKLQCCVWLKLTEILYDVTWEIKTPPKWDSTLSFSRYFVHLLLDYTSLFFAI